jgi:hypothetical protein
MHVIFLLLVIAQSSLIMEKKVDYLCTRLPCAWLGERVPSTASHERRMHQDLLKTNKSFRSLLANHDHHVDCLHYVGSAF